MPKLEVCKSDEFVVCDCAIFFFFFSFFGETIRTDNTRHDGGHLSRYHGRYHGPLRTAPRGCRAACRRVAHTHQPTHSTPPTRQKPPLSLCLLAKIPAVFFRVPANPAKSRLAGAAARETQRHGPRGSPLSSAGSAVWCVMRISSTHLFWAKCPPTARSLLY